MVIPIKGRASCSIGSPSALMAPLFRFSAPSAEIPGLLGGHFPAITPGGSADGDRIQSFARFFFMRHVGVTSTVATIISRLGRADRLL